MLKLYFKAINLLLTAIQRLRSLKYLTKRYHVEGFRLYITIIIACTFLSIFWASFAEIDRVIRIGGKIITAGRGQEIQHLEGGIIASIQTTEGAAVKKGDLLLTIDNVAATSNLDETKVKIAFQAARIARLEAEIRGGDTIEFAETLKDTAVAKVENNLFLSRRAKLKQEILVHEQASNQQAAKLNEIRTRQAKLTQELNIARNRSKLLEDMLRRGAASKLETLEAQGMEQRLETSINDAVTSIPTIEAAIAEEKARTQSLKTDFINTAQNDLVLATAEKERLEKVLLNDSDRFRRTEIHAPMDGIINRINVNTIGGVIKPGDKIIELIPYTDEVIIEARAQPKDRGYLRPGLDATVRISAYDVGEFGVLKSVVTEVSADTMHDSRGEAFYRVNLLVGSIPKTYQNHIMVPGMTVTADVVTGKNTIMGLILSPIRNFTSNMFRD